MLANSWESLLFLDCQLLDACKAPIQIHGVPRQFSHLDAGKPWRNGNGINYSAFFDPNFEDCTGLGERAVLGTLSSLIKWPLDDSPDLGQVIGENGSVNVFQKKEL